MSTLFKRTIYLNRIQPFIGKQLIKVITGQRRVGKSFLLFQLMGEIKKTDKKASIIYINKEDLAFESIKTGKDLYDYVQKEKSTIAKTYLFVDEIQDIDGFEVGLRSLALDSTMDIYCSGSNANLLSGELATYLSGRYVEIPVYSLSYTEFMTFHQLNDNAETIEKYLKFGGLPFLIHLQLEDSIVFEYIKSVYQTILYRDIIQRHSLRNSRFLEQLVQFLADNIGSIFSAKKISDYLKSQAINLASNQVQTYIKYLTDAYIIHQVERYDIVGKRIFETNEKYYFENLGIRNGIRGYKPNDKGKLLENAVYNHLCLHGYKIYVGTLNPEEIDFVCEKGGERLYIQVALSLNEEKTIEREFGNLLKIKDQYPKIVVTLEGFKGNTYEGIKTLSIREFLLRNE
jgi:uncharacterized protein